MINPRIDPEGRKKPYMTEYDPKEIGSLYEGREGSAFLDHVGVATREELLEATLLGEWTRYIEEGLDTVWSWHKGKFYLLSQKKVT